MDTGRRKIIKLEIIASINFGDEITVFYSSEDFFGAGNARCLCPQVGLHTKRVQKKFEKKRPETLYVGCSRLQQKRRRIFVTTKTKVKKQRLQELRHFEESSSSSDFESDSDTSTTVSSSDRQQSVSSGNECEDANEIRSFVERNIISSPQSCPHSPNFSLKNVESNFLTMHSESETEDEKENSDIEGRLRVAGEKNFLICVNEIIAQSGTSEIEAGRWIKLMRTAFPEKNIPSYKTIRKRYAIGKSLEKSASGNVQKVLCIPCTTLMRSKRLSRRTFIQ